MLHDLVWPLLYYIQANHVPYGWQNWSAQARQEIFRTGPAMMRFVKVLAVSPGFFVPLLPIVGLGLFGYWMAQMRRREAARHQVEYYLLICAALSGLLVSVLVVRPDIIHLMYLAPLWYVVLAWIIGSRYFYSRTLGKTRPYLIAYASAAFSMMGLAILLTATGARNRVETRRGMITTRERDSVVEFIQAHVAPGEEILVYPYLPLYSYLTA